MKYNNNSSYGKEHRLKRLFKGENIIILPVDDILISGPENGLKKINNLFQTEILNEVNAVLGYEGSFLRNRSIEVEHIQNLTASTNHINTNNKVLVSTVEKALINDSVAIAAHINISSKFESNMLERLGKVSNEADRYGMPFFCLSYPRKEDHFGILDNYEKTKKEDVKKYTSLVSHCVRVAVELGADIVKTQFTGSIDSFSEVVSVASNVPIVIAGGKEIGIEKTLMMAYQSISAGAKGISIGRNIYNDPNPLVAIKALSMVVNSNELPENALSWYYDNCER